MLNKATTQEIEISQIFNDYNCKVRAIDPHFVDKMYQDVLSGGVFKYNEKIFVCTLKNNYQSKHYVISGSHR